MLSTLAKPGAYTGSLIRIIFDCRGIRGGGYIGGQKVEREGNGYAFTRLGCRKSE